MRERGPVRIDDADYTADIQQFVDGVQSGEIVAGRLQRLAVRRHQHDLEHAGARGYYFCEEAANHAIWFIETCCVHIKTSVSAKAGDPLLLSPSQKFIAWCLFGWRRRRDDRRRFEKGWIEVARKWGKSIFAAAVCLCLLVFDGEESAEIYAAATKEDQAKIVLNAAKAMVQKSPSLRKRLRVLQKAITHNTFSTMQAVGSDSLSTDGLNPHGVVMDELHAWQERHRGLHEKLTTGSDARLQPLFITITTAGDDKSNLWAEQRDYVVRCVESVLTDTIVDDTVFAFVACMDYPHEYACIECDGSGCDWCDQGICYPDDEYELDSLRKANPNIGITIAEFKTETWVNEAKQNPVSRNKYLRYYANVRVSSTEKLIESVVWAGGNGDVAVNPGDYCCGGFDLGRSDDFSSWTALFPEEVEWNGEPVKRYQAISKSYTCEDRSPELQTVEIDEWIADGLLEVHDGDQIDFAAIRRDIIEVSSTYQVRSWGFDPTFAKQLSQELINDHGIECFPVHQTAAKYNEPIRELLRLLKRKHLTHGGNACLAWQAQNLLVKKDAKDLWMPDKGESLNKIDAMVSLLMALSECIFHKDDVVAYHGAGEVFFG